LVLRDYNPAFVEGVFELREGTDRAKSVILTSQMYFEAFFDYDQAYLIRGLPLSITGGQKKSFQSNLPLLEEMIQNDVDFIVLENGRQETILDIFSDVGIEPEIWWEDKNIVIYEVNGR
jgi:hypothetical protein